MQQKKLWLSWRMILPLEELKMIVTPVCEPPMNDFQSYFQMLGEDLDEMTLMNAASQR